MSPLKVLIIHNEYQEPGGETAVVDSEIALLRQRGHSVVVYGRHNDEIRRFRMLEKAAFVPRALYSRRTYRDIRRLVDAEGPDVAHVHNVFPLISPSAYHALKDAAVPIVQTVHNFRLMCPNGLFFTHGEICERCLHGNTLPAVRLRCFRDSYVLSGIYALSIGGHRLSRTFDLIDRFVVPTAFSGAKLAEGGVAPEQRVSLLDYFLPDPLPRSGSFARRHPGFLYVGRLSDEKGIWTLIEAMRGLPQITLKVMGSGPLEVPIRAYLDRWHMQNVQMCGFVSGEAKWDALRSALAVVVPSRCYELGPLSMVESLVAGTPVVAPDLAHFPAAIKDRHTGLLFRAGDADDLQSKLAWLADDVDRAVAMGRLAREAAESRYTADAHYRGLLHIYEQVVA